MQFSPQLIAAIGSIATEEQLNYLPNSVVDIVETVAEVWWSAKDACTSPTGERSEEDQIWLDQYQRVIVNLIKDQLDVIAR
jgi:hypothetical protein